MPVATAQIAKPSLWCPGRNPDAWELWRGCVGLWPFWAGAGTAVYDFSLYHNLLSASIGSISWVTDLYGIVGDFNADRLYVAGSDVAGHSLDFTTDFTLWCFARPDGGDTYKHILGKRGAAGYQYQFRVDGTLAINILTTTGGSVAGDTTLTLGKWYSMAATLSSTDSTKRLWLDGIEDGSDTNSSCSHVAEEFSVGNQMQGLASYTGAIAIAGAWNRALSGHELMQLTADPFCMIRPPEFTPFWDAAAEAPSACAMPILGGGISMFRGGILRG